MEKKNNYELVIYFFWNCKLLKYEQWTELFILKCATVMQFAL